MQLGYGSIERSSDQEQRNRHDGFALAFKLGVTIRLSSGAAAGGRHSAWVTICGLPERFQSRRLPITAEAASGVLQTSS